MNKPAILQVYVLKTKYVVINVKSIYIMEQLRCTAVKLGMHIQFIMRTNNEKYQNYMYLPKYKIPIVTIIVY